MKKPFEPRRIRSPRPLVAVCVLGAVLMPLSGWSVYHQQGLTLLSGGMMVATIVAWAGLLDVLTTEVRVTETELVIRSSFRRRSYPRTAFQSVTREKGSPVALKLAEGGWVMLPSTIGTGQGLVNTLRAWIKREGA